MGINKEFQFENLAALYEDMANWPFRKDIERPAVLERLGDISELNVLDFGCGSGHYSRLLKSQGAARVVGYDVAGGMLQYAKTREQAENQGIEYVSELSELTGQFDVVLAVYVLPYASTRTELINMVKSMAKLLRPGGRLLTLPLNPDYVPEASYYKPYGFQLTSDTPHQDGTEVSLRLLVDDKHTDITAWYWSRDTLDNALHQSGFSRVQWLTPDPQCKTASSIPSLEAYLQRPHTLLVDCFYQG